MSTSSICTINEAALVEEIDRAKQRLTYVAPGVTERVAEALARAWKRLGTTSVSIILDLDAEVYRLGYGTEQGWNVLQGAASNLRELILHQPGVRICVLVSDETTLVFAPTPLLVEAGPTTFAEPNAIRLEKAPLALQQELGISADGESKRTIGLDPVPPGKVEQLKRDLAENPPVKFDLARKVRVFNSQLEFVELELHGCFVSRKTASISPDLMGLAEDEETRRRLRSSFKVLGEDDLVDEDKKLSEKTLKDERKRITDKYLTPLQGFGTVILRANKQAFESEIEGLKKLVAEFQEKLKTKLTALMDVNAKKLAEALAPSVERKRPERWTRFLGPNPKQEDTRRQLEAEIRQAFGEVEDIVSEMGVSIVFKGVTYETLMNEKFRKLAQDEFPHLRLMDEYEAARQSAQTEVKR